ncbi:PAS domain-containing protein [Flavobacterium sp.]|uniref:sensor histidine kinase n=1 Tax=Flavobacterium sp. TaxID=239 RepID=UPI002617CE41|nr:sensor histidine kinase [Flavobacterium sp.]
MMFSENTMTEKIENQYLKKIIGQLPSLFFQFTINNTLKISVDFIEGSLFDFYELSKETFELDAIAAIESRIHEEDLMHFKDSICTSYITLQKWDSDYRVVLPTKGLKWMKVVATVEKISDDEVVFYGVITDVTNQKLVEEAHQVTDERNKFANMASNVGVWDWNLITNEVAYSPESLRILEIPEQNLAMVSNPEICDAQVHPDDREDYFGNIKKHFNQEIPYYETYHRVLCNGKYKWILDRGKVIARDKQGKPLRMVGTHTDITSQKEREVHLEETLRLVNNQKNKLLNFAYIVSHNLKSYGGNLSTLIKLNESGMFEQTEFLAYIKTISNELNDSIDNLSDLIKVQNNQDITKDHLNLKEYLKKVFNILTEDIHFAKVSIVDLIPADATVLFNPAYLESVLLNLTTNAIKYASPDRTPVIKYSLECENDYQVLVIEDNGIGIDLDTNREHLFGLYKTFHTNKDSNGIGLHITKNQIDVMDGKIEVESSIDKGSVFKVFFKK